MNRVDRCPACQSAPVDQPPVQVQSEGDRSDDQKSGGGYRLACFAGLAAGIGVLTGGSTLAAEINVPVNYPTLQAAIDAAAPDDIITLSPGVYTGRFNISGKALTIEGGGLATLDGDGQPGSVVAIAGVTTGSVTLRGLTIRNGAGTIVDSPCWPFGPSPFGGGIRVDGSSVNLTGVQLLSNTATLGGGLWYENGSNITLDACVVSDNFGGEVAAAVGGCWFGAPSVLTVRNSTISSNHLVTFQNRFGIVTPGVGSASFESTVFENNFDTAGVLQSPGATNTLTVNACTFRNNQRWGGSIYSTQGTSASSLAVTNTLFENEFGLAEGGRGSVLVISNSTGASSVRDCTFRNVVTNGVEVFLQGGGSFAVERCRMEDMPDSSVFGLADGGASFLVRDVQSIGGSVNTVLRGGSYARVDRVSVRASAQDAFLINVGGSSTAEYSNILAADAILKGVTVVLNDEEEPGQTVSVVRLTNMTLAGNLIGLDLGAVFIGQTSLSNSIIAGNTAADYLPTLVSERVTASNCLINGGIYPGVNLFDAPPQFVAPSLGDYRLASGSPAIDAGSNALLLADMPLDLDGQPRRVGPGATPVVDLGAYEAAPAIARCGLSDVAGPGQAAGPDNALTADDIIVFLNRFFASDARSDVAGPGQSTVPDSQFTADDIIVFLNRFFAGC